MKSNIRKIATRAVTIFGMVFLMGLSLFGGAQSLRVRAQENIPATVDTYSPIGTVINLFDYWVESEDAADNSDIADHINKGINKDHILTFMKSSDVLNGDRERNIDANKYTGASGGPRDNIVENWLGDDGYPVLRQGSNGISRSESLDYLFDATDFEGKKAYINAKDLLKVDGDGYYTYNSKENFAAFDEDTNSFSIYEKAAVKNGNDIYPVGGNVGQFFPFNSAQEVFDGDVTSTDARLNHYFGVTVTSRFIQPTNGYVNGEAMTYEFAGDDDVWIFIDDILVADLGGIHSAVSTKIDFSTGHVYISNTESVNANASPTTTLYDQYREAYLEKYGPSEANARLDKMFDQKGRNFVFSDDSVHTIKFFYLERGNGASNMNLKFNLKSVPENSIVKVDEMGSAISGVRFRLYQADENYNYNEDSDLISFGTSDDAGNITLVDIDDPNSIIDFNELHDRGIDHYVLREISDTNNRDYRISPDIKLHYTTYGGDDDLGLVMVDNTFETGAYSLPRQLISMNAVLPVTKAPGDREIEVDLSKGGTAFAVVMYRDKNEDCANDAGCWYPLSGDAMSGYKKASESALNPEDGVKEEIIAVGKENNYIANVSSNGAYEILVDEMPGNIDQYYFVNGQNLANTSFNVALFYTEGNLSEATPENTYFINTIQGSEYITRTFSSSVHVPNVVNRLIVQKLDSQNNVIGDPDDPDSALNATFALYREDAVVDGKLVEGALPHDTVRVNQKTYGSNYINVEDATVNAAIFPSTNGKLQNGTYYLKEITAPEGYAINDQLVKIIVNDDGVFADAGSQNDGVFVRSGVGHVLKTMAQFTAADDIDNTLTNIVTTLETSSDLKNWTSQDGSTIHLKHKDTLNNGNLYIEYGKEVEDPNGPYITAGSDVGYTRLSIKQCKEHTTTPRQELSLEDNLAHLFTGTTIVQISDDPLIGGSKTVSGKDNWGEDFTIKLELISKDGVAATDTSLNQEITLSGVNAKENAPVSYELNKIKFNSVGTYIFKISEEKGTNQSYAYDDTIYYLKAEVTLDDVGQKGVLHTSYEIVDESGNKIEGAKLDELNFHNVYMELSTLNIQKIVNAPEGLTPDGETSFKVEVSFTLPDDFDKDTYALLDGETANEGDINFKDHIDDANLSFTIKANEVKNIINIPKGVTYTISEANIPQGFSLNTAQSTSLSGTLGNDDINVRLVNDYNVAPIQDTITIIKNFEGREWRDTDNFSFIIEGTGLNGQKSVTIDNNSQDHSEDFALAFDKPGEYTYRIEEASPQSSIPGVSYSSEVYNVKFNVIDNGDGTLSVDEKTITKDDQTAQSVTFTNSYNAGDPIAIDMIGRKNYTDNTNALPLEKDMFTFIVEAEDGAPLPSIANGNREWRVTNDKEGSINFGNLTINKDYFTSKPQSLEYTYTIKEDTANPIEGMTYDDTVYTVNMTITIDEDENISRIVKFFKDGQEFTPAQGEVAVTFENSYTAKSAEAVLGFGKELNTPKGFDFDKAPDTNFTFTLEANDDKTKDAVTKGDVLMPSNLEVSLPLKDLKDGEISSSFEAISFNKVGKYTFKISENKGDAKGFSYDQTPIIATVDVKLNEDTNSLEYTIAYQKGDVNGSDILTFANEYKLSKSDPVSLVGEKTMQGWNLTNNAFTFLITDPNRESTTVSNSYPTDEHTAVINLINGVTFDEVGEYTYTVNEIESNGLGLSDDVIKYDESEYTITYDVTIDYGNAKLIATPTILKNDQEVQKVTFENIYDPGTLEVDGQLSKVLEGRDLNDGEFEFEIKLLDEYSTNNTGATIDNTLLVNDAKGKINYHISFNDVGIFTFEVKERIPTNTNGVIYDSTSSHLYYWIEVDDTGKLYIDQFDIPKNTFTNKYEANGSFTLGLEKVIDGRDWNDDSFTFKIEGLDDLTKDAINNGLIMTDDAKKVENGFEVVINAQSTDHKQDLTFDVKGSGDKTYNFKISEVFDENDDEFYYDDSEKTLVVTQSDNSKGVLNLTPDNGSFTFTNEYRFKGEKAAKVDLKASKVMRLPEGVEYTMADDEFTFTLTPQDNNSKYDPVSETTVTSGVASDNKADFSVLSNVVYERPGTYFYDLKEVDDGKAGISYDASAYTIKVDVKINDESKKLEATVSIDKDGEAVNDIVFENVFNPNEITLELVGTKTLLFEDNYKYFDEGMFKFLVSDGETQKEVSNTASSGGKASIAFGSYTYTRDDIGKEYHYTVKELADDSNKNYTYDTREYEIIVKVDVAQTSGINDVLTLDVSYLADGEATDQIEFVNHYMPEATSFDLTGIKELLVNEDKIKLEKDAFSFELYDDNNDLIKTVTNDENGNFTFQDIAITSSESHFRVSEKIGNDPNITYDQNIYDVSVKAKDENGTWVVEKVELSLASKEVSDLKFTNKYDPKALSLNLEGLKELSGRTLKDSEFLFEVRDDQGQLVAASRNDASGKIVFELDSLSPDATYQIKEVASSDPQITYDDKVYELVIKADFDGSKLNVTYDLKLDGKVIDDIVFNNTYSEPPASEVEDDPIIGEGEIQIPNTSVK